MILANLYELTVGGIRNGFDVYDTDTGKQWHLASDELQKLLLKIDNIRNNGNFDWDFYKIPRYFKYNGLFCYCNGGSVYIWFKGFGFVINGYDYVVDVRPSSEDSVSMYIDNAISNIFHIMLEYDTLNILNGWSNQQYNGSYKVGVKQSLSSFKRSIYIGGS